MQEQAEKAARCSVLCLFCARPSTHVSPCLQRLWRRMELHYGVQISAAAQLSLWPSLLLFPPRSELCVSLITLKQRTIFCSCVLFMTLIVLYNCSLGPGNILSSDLFVSLCGCTACSSIHLLFCFSIFLIQTSWYQRGQRSNKTPWNHLPTFHPRW